MSVFKSEPVAFQLGDVIGQYHRLGWDFLEIHDAHTSFSQRGEMYLEWNESDTEPMGKMVILKETPQEETNLETY